MTEIITSHQKKDYCYHKTLDKFVLSTRLGFVHQLCNNRLIFYSVSNGNGIFIGSYPKSDKSN